MFLTKKTIKIKELEREIEYLKKEHSLNLFEARLKEKEGYIEENKNQELQIAAQSVRIEELQKRHAESPYSLLSDILKALTVKLPTLDIKELSVHEKDKRDK